MAWSVLQAALTVTLLAASTLPQHKPIVRRFTTGTEEHYKLTVTLKAETHSVATQTISSRTYVAPVERLAEVRADWRADRRVVDMQSDGSAQIGETVTPTSRGCGPATQRQENTDPDLQRSLGQICAKLTTATTIRYLENRTGLQTEQMETRLTDFGEQSPPLLALWLRRALRPSVILPALSFEIGAKSQQSIHPSGEALGNASGSESTEWLEAQGESPAASLHVVQQMAWSAPAPLPKASETAQGSSPSTALRQEFFADSLSTVSLIDGSLLRARRSASRTSRHALDAVPSLPEPPTFSSKLTVLVEIERLP